MAAPIIVPAGPPQGALGYSTACPTCGAQLAPHVGPPQNTPWLCIGCRRGWWTAELASSARAVFRPGPDDFGYGTTVAQAVQAELAAAVVRGDSVHPSMVAVPGVAAQLAALQKKG